MEDRVILSFHGVLLPNIYAPFPCTLLHMHVRPFGTCEVCTRNITVQQLGQLKQANIHIHVNAHMHVRINIHIYVHAYI